MMINKFIPCCYNSGNTTTGHFNFIRLLEYEFCSLQQSKSSNMIMHADVLKETHLPGALVPCLSSCNSRCRDRESRTGVVRPEAPFAFWLLSQLHRVTLVSHVPLWLQKRVSFWVLHIPGIYISHMKGRKAAGWCETGIGRGTFC